MKDSYFRRLLRRLGAAFFLFFGAAFRFRRLGAAFFLAAFRRRRLGAAFLAAFRRRRFGAALRLAGFRLAAFRFFGAALRLRFRAGIFCYTSLLFCKERFCSLQDYFYLSFCVKEK